MNESCSECGVDCEDDCHFQGIEPFCADHCPDCSDVPVSDVISPLLNEVGK